MQQNKNETLYMHTCTLFMCISCEYVTENQIFKSLFFNTSYTLLFCKV